MVLLSKLGPVSPTIVNLSSFLSGHLGYPYYCEPPKGTLSEAKSARRGRAYRSREELYSDKIEIGQSKCCSLFDQTGCPNGHFYCPNGHFIEKGQKVPKWVSTG